MNDAEYDKLEEEHKREERLQELAKEHRGRVCYDPQFGRGVHVHAFKFVTEDGTVIHELP